MAAQGPKGPMKVPSPPHERLSQALGRKPMSFSPAVAGPRIAPQPAQTRDYGKQSPVAIPGMPFNGAPT
jgi:hypothetical protein